MPPKLYILHSINDSTFFKPYLSAFNNSISLAKSGALRVEREKIQARSPQEY